MKKLINQPSAVVEEMVEGLVAVYPGLRRVPGHTVLVRSDLAAVPDRPVAIISGGGSGHEPAHAGYVGRGMLAGAVAGDVFTSPAPDAILAAIRATAGSRGVLLVVKNYTGDRLNFGLAAEMARGEGITVEMVVVADDVALAGSSGAGARGLAGTILVHKVAGACAEAGGSLADVATEARAVAQSVRTMGVALSPCTVPAAGSPTFHLDQNEMELGLGIHGEPGIRRIPLEPADALVDRLLESIVAGQETGTGRVVLLINNLGGTPTMELAIVARRAVAVLEKSGRAVERVFMGTFLSSLEMAGVSLSVLPVDDACLIRLDAPTEAPAWPNAAARPRNRTVPSAEILPSVSGPVPTGQPRTALGQALQAAIRSVADALIRESPRLTQLDQPVGDGDMGISLERGARAILAALPSYPLDDPAATLRAVGLIWQRAVGGTSGPLYAAFLLRAASRLRSGPLGDPSVWAEAFLAGCTAITDLGGAKRGDRTMLDALGPAAEAFHQAAESGGGIPEGIRAAADAAAAGARATAAMLPRRGRSSYLGERVLGHPDPGAEAIAVCVAALQEGMRDEGRKKKGTADERR
jgi:ATP-dependent dihydroxyacetone kinase